MARMVDFDNDGVDFDDGLRLTTEGEFRFDGNWIVRVGVYRRYQGERDFEREATVHVRTGPTARTIEASVLLKRAERRLSGD